MATDFLKLLSSLGLSNAETRMYLAGLELGPTSVQVIAKKAKISRTAAYEIIEALQKRGLVSSFMRDKKRFFVSEDPERAAQHFREQIELMTKRISEFDRAVPEMKMLVGGERPAVRFYEGREAVLSLFHDVSEVKPDRLDEFYNLDDFYQVEDIDYIRSVRENVDRSKMKIRSLHRGKITQPSRRDAEFCELLPELGMFHGEIWIYGNRVAFVSFVGKLMAVIIECEEFSNMARVLFEATWRLCKQAEGLK